uniref:Uncharacterized protein n=1 Tax=Chromera velia CCMP2878 TaxID=1169474 RepID=A0A0G4H544_9ALVE|eukprot:Cvel_24719.t1-p1 / transcript=Cvel_24719.t1 / gene=Cvel_24719 / organism=Chromera_velia_CCMP2878 / gene_product=hypothetical protein / transcript_product=hypothetical protein / location=Cvel_scaffold2712:15776-20227(-) / protein_length=819 / sequence_SO=supercontig / SO=protein_coding / is_pseudo=false
MGDDLPVTVPVTRQILYLDDLDERNVRFLLLYSLNILINHLNGGFECVDSMRVLKEFSDPLAGIQKFRFGIHDSNFRFVSLRDAVKAKMGKDIRKVIAEDEFVCDVFVAVKLEGRDVYRPIEGYESSDTAILLDTFFGKWDQKRGVPKIEYSPSLVFPPDFRRFSDDPEEQDLRCTYEKLRASKQREWLQAVYKVAAARLESASVLAYLAGDLDADAEGGAGGVSGGGNQSQLRASLMRPEPQTEKDTLEGGAANGSSAPAAAEAREARRWLDLGVDPEELERACPRPLLPAKDDRLPTLKEFLLNDRDMTANLDHQLPLVIGQSPEGQVRVGLRRAAWQWRKFFEVAVDSMCVEKDFMADVPPLRSSPPLSDVLMGTETSYQGASKSINAHSPPIPNASSSTLPPSSSKPTTHLGSPSLPRDSTSADPTARMREEREREKDREIPSVSASSPQAPPAIPEEREKERVEQPKPTQKEPEAEDHSAKQSPPKVVLIKQTSPPGGAPDGSINGGGASLPRSGRASPGPSSASSPATGVVSAGGGKGPVRLSSSASAGDRERARERELQLDRDRERERQALRDSASARNRERQGGVGERERDRDRGSERGRDRDSRLGERRRSRSRSRSQGAQSRGAGDPRVRLLPRSGAPPNPAAGQQAGGGRPRPPGSCDWIEGSTAIGPRSGLHLGLEMDRAEPKLTDAQKRRFWAIYDTEGKLPPVWKDGMKIEDFKRYYGVEKFMAMGWHPVQGGLPPAHQIFDAAGGCPWCTHIFGNRSAHRRHMTHEYFHCYKRKGLCPKCRSGPHHEMECKARMDARDREGNRW